MLKTIVAGTQLLVGGLVPAFLGSGQPLAGPSIYNMDHLLTEPYPFVSRKVSPAGSSQDELFSTLSEKKMSATLARPLIYEMDRLLAEKYPFSTRIVSSTGSFQVTQPRISPKTKIYKSSTSRLIYKMDHLLEEPNPFVTRIISSTGSSLVTLPKTPMSESLSGRLVYNMDRLIGEPYPLETQRVSYTGPTQVTQFGTSPKTSTLKAGALQVESTKDAPDFDVFSSGEKVHFPSANDPLEAINRITFEFNEFTNQFLLNPIAKGYNAALPNFMRKAIANILNNINGPGVLVNDLLQGEFKRGLTTAIRLVINSTAGVGGLVDVAERFGFVGHKEDFGQTMAVWGIGDGFYLVLPLLGPSNPRDALGQIFVDSYFDPLGYYLDEEDLNEIDYGLTGLSGIVTYARVMDQLDRMRETSIDFYGTLRSLYLQRRNSEIMNNAKGAPLSIGVNID